MGAAARAGLPALAIALALAALRLTSLDAGAISREALAAWQQQTGGEAQAAGAAFALFPSPGLRLQGPDATFDGMHIHAAEALLGLRWMPLLLGKVEIDTLTLPEAELRTTRTGSDALPDASRLARLPLDRLRLIRARLVNAKGRVLLDEISLDLRHPGPNREMLWELQAGHGQKALRGHGRLDFRLGRLTRGFGKFRFRDMPPDAPLTLLTGRPMPAIAREWRASGAVTLRIASRKRWSLFGEADLATASGTVHLRGKIEHVRGVTRWRDSFAHFPNQGVISLEGQCASGECRASAHLRQTPLAPFAGWLLPPSAPRLSGLAEGELAGTWRAPGRNGATGHASGALTIKAELAMEERHWRLPPFRLRLTSAAFRPDAFLLDASLAPAASSAKHAGASGIGLHAERTQGGLRLVVAQADNWPQGAGQLAQALLAARLPEASWPADIGFSRLVWRREGQGSNERETLQMEAPRITGAFAWHGIRKPAGLPAACERIRLAWNAGVSDWRLHGCRIAGSHWKTLRISAETGGIRVQAGTANLDFDALAQAGMHLPPPWHELRGKIAGNAGIVLSGQAKAAIRAATLDLQDFGLPDWRVSGQLQADDASIAAPHLLLRGPRGHASLALRLDTARRIADVTVLDGHLDWSSPAALPGWLASLALKGRIEQASLRWLGQTFHLAAPDFRWQDGALRLSSLNARVAGGRLRARKLRLAPAPEGRLAIAGDIRASGVRLARLEHLADVLHARLRGRLHANLHLELAIPGDVRAWRADGDLLVFSGAWQPLQGGSAGHEYAFRRLDARIRLRQGALRIREFRLLSHGRRYRGRLRIENGRFSGEARTPERTRIRIEGDWPIPGWHLLSSMK